MARPILSASRFVAQGFGFLIEPCGRTACLICGNRARHVIPHEQEGDVYCLHVQERDHDDSSQGRRAYCVYRAEADTMLVDLEELDALGPEAAKVERSATNCDDDDDDVPDGDFDERRKGEPEENSAVLPRREVRAPSAQEREAHELEGHTECAPWCESRVAGKAHERQQRRARGDLPRSVAVIDDYSFITAGESFDGTKASLCQVSQVGQRLYQQWCLQASGGQICHRNDDGLLGAPRLQEGDPLVRRRELDTRLVARRKAVRRLGGAHPDHPKGPLRQCRVTSPAWSGPCDAGWRGGLARRST